MQLNVIPNQSEAAETEYPSRNVMVADWKRKRLENAQYRVIGNHSAVKTCHWCKSKVTGKDGCYKETFYDVHAHKCLEMSPAITCNQRCLHCWRDTSVFSAGWVGPVDDPKEIIKGCIEARKELMMGFGGNDKVSREQFEDSLIPDHAAISLTGEPCMYPRLDEMVQSFFEDFNFRTVFLVTSGTVPESLKKMEKNVLPTNVYISLEATNPEQYKKLCIPVVENAWEKVNESLDILSQMNTRTLIRITAMKGMNMDNPKGFAEMIEKGRPKFVEVKSYMFIGKSRERMQIDNMASMDEVREFASEITDHCSYKVNDEIEASRIVQLKRI